MFSLLDYEFEVSTDEAMTILKDDTNIPIDSVPITQGTLRQNSLQYNLHSFKNLVREVMYVFVIPDYR